MARFFTDGINPDLNSVKIYGDDYKHIKDVLRLKAGNSIVLCDGKKNDYDAVIESLGDGCITVSVVGQRSNGSEPPVEITLFQGIAKGEKMNLIVQKCVELGVFEIVPMVTLRTIVGIKGEREREIKRTRWQRIALEAAKQAGRGVIPKVREIIKLNEVNLESFNLILLPFEKEGIVSLKDVLSTVPRDGEIKKIGVFIGPEGGFDEKEVDFIKSHGGRSVTLGPRILRTETAGLAIISVLMYEFGAMDKKLQ